VVRPNALRSKPFDSWQPFWDRPFYRYKGLVVSIVALGIPRCVSFVNALIHMETASSCCHRNHPHDTIVLHNSSHSCRSPPGGPARERQHILKSGKRSMSQEQPWHATWRLGGNPFRSEYPRHQAELSFPVVQADTLELKMPTTCTPEQLPMLWSETARTAYKISPQSKRLRPVKRIQNRISCVRRDLDRRRRQSTGIMNRSSRRRGHMC
jgi:hypothetical protein